MPNKSIRRAITGAALTLVLASAATAQTAPDTLAPTGRWTANTDGRAPVPPMGWNSWNAFYSDVDEEKLMASASIIRESGLQAAGYRYINIDDGWWLKRRQPDGRMVIRADNFPSARTGRKDVTSFRPLTDRLHALGFKAGIYSDIGRNSCVQIYTPQFPNQPEGSIAEREVGLYDHVDQDIRLYFAEWGFDAIKVDGCGVRGLGADSEHVKAGRYRQFDPLIDMNAIQRTEIGTVRGLFDRVHDALKRHNPDGDYMFSVCLWGSSNVREWAHEVGNISRTSDDITSDWARMLTNFDTTLTRALYAQPGTWNDPDMLFVGQGDFDKDHMREARSHFALWAIVNAPLLIGYDLRKATPEQLALLGNKALIALNQDPGGHQAVPAYLSDDVQLLVKTLANGDKAVAIFNRGLKPMKATLTAGHLKMRDDMSIALTDLWGGPGKTFTKEQAFEVAPRETLVFTAKGTRTLAEGMYLSEVPGDVNPAEDGVVVPAADPTIHHSVIPWISTRGSGEHPQYAGWGGAQADRSPFMTPLRVDGQAIDTGLGVLANSRLEVRNHGATRFAAKVGVDDGASMRDRAVVFEVYGDGRLLKRSAPMHADQAAVPIEADVRGVKLVELVARAEGDQPAGAALPIVWGEARLLR